MRDAGHDGLRRWGALMLQLSGVTTGRSPTQVQGIESVRQTRDEIKRRVLQLLEREQLTGNVISV
jgi:hypothetical protein